jgi:C4-type Zn-finger protein
MQFHVSETCPRCRKPVRLATIEPHPTRTDIALHSFECAECGYVRTKDVSLRADKSPPELSVNPTTGSGF